MLALLWICISLSIPTDLSVSSSSNSFATAYGPVICDPVFGFLRAAC